MLESDSLVTSARLPSLARGTGTAQASLSLQAG